MKATQGLKNIISYLEKAVFDSSKNIDDMGERLEIRVQFNFADGTNIDLQLNETGKTIHEYFQKAESKDVDLLN
jgi:hypothetical protein